MLRIFIWFVVGWTVLANYPYFALGTCNATCKACSSKQQTNFCLGCEASLSFDSSKGTCSIPVTDRTSYIELFGLVHLQNTSDQLTDWTKYNVTTNSPLSNSDLWGCCNSNQANYFNFDLVGLFGSTFDIRRQFTFAYDLESVQLMFRGFFFISPIKFVATINTDQVISETTDGSFDVPPPILNSTNQVLDCSVFNYETASIYSRKFVSDKLSLQTNTIIVKISANYAATSSTSGNSYWGVRQLVLLAVRCSSCASPELISFARTTGIAFGCILAVLLLLGAPFLIYGHLHSKELAKKRQQVYSNIVHTNTLANKIRSRHSSR